MSQRTVTLLGAASALALAAMAFNPANADGVINGTLQGDYSNLSASGGGGSANNWGGSGSADFAFPDTGVAAQLDAGYHDLTIPHSSSIASWNVGGDLFWTGDRGRLGATLNFEQFNCCDFSENARNYGAFAELYVMPELTVGVKGGAFNGDNGLKGAYAGGEAVGYVMPDLAVSGLLDYTSLDHSISDTDYTAQGEWLVSEQMPISVTLGYTRSELSHGDGDANTVMVGVKLYLDNNGAQTLADRQRTGTESWGSKFNATTLFEF